MPSFFVPSRSSRHRTACPYFRVFRVGLGTVLAFPLGLVLPVFLLSLTPVAGFALYRALIRSAREIPLPETLAPVATKPSAAPVHPTLPVIRKGFRQNRRDTSPRLVYAALQNGYKFLDLLAEARTPASAAHTSIVAFLEKRAAAARARAAAAALAEANAPPARPPYVPRKLLTRRPVADQPGGTFSEARLPYYFYEYVATERPLPLARLRAAKDGRRRVPRLATDAVGIPFLRLGKPQSRVLSQVLFAKRSKRLRRMGLASRMLREDLGFAAEEDRWEAVVATQLQKQRLQGPAEEDHASASEETTYASSVSVGIQYLWAKLNSESADMVLRAKAMLALVNAEQALADQEDEERRQREAAEAAAGDAATTAADPAIGDRPHAS